MHAQPYLKCRRTCTALIAKRRTITSFWTVEAGYSTELQYRKVVLLKPETANV
jgi:hypothetical protein